MFYDSDDSDDEYFIYGLNDYRNHGFGLMYSDEYDSDNDGYDSDYSFEWRNSFESSYGSYRGCYSPSIFPDIKKLSDESVRRIFRIKSENLAPIYTYPHHGDHEQHLTRKLETPHLEQLWECTFYLKEIVDIGFGRKELTRDEVKEEGVLHLWNGSVKEFVSLKEDACEMSHRWFLWINDLFIEKLQSFIPSGLPYTAWENIISHLSSGTSTKMLSSKLGCFSENLEDQIVERLLTRNCILATVNLFENIHSLLYGGTTCLHSNTIRYRLSLGLSEYACKMEHLASLLGTSENLSRCLYHTALNQFSLESFDSCFLDKNIEEDIDIFKVIGCNSDCHFNILVPGLGEKSYNLLCIDKNCAVSKEDFSYLFVPTPIISNGKPIIISGDGIVAAYYKDGENANINTISVWDVSDRGPFEDRGELIFQSIAKDLVKGCKNTVNLSSVTLSISGIVNLEKTVKFIFDIVPMESDGIPLCMIVESYKTKHAPRFTFFRAAPQPYCIPHSKCLGINGSLAYILDDDTHTLNVHDLSCNDNTITAMSILRHGSQWKVVFDSSKDRNIFALYKNNHFQIRLNNESLTVVKEMEIDFGRHLNSHMEEIKFQMCDSILYGCLELQEDRYETESIFLQSNARYELLSNEFLMDRFASSQTTHFSIDLLSEYTKLTFLDFGKLESNNRFQDDVPSVKFNLSGFNKNKELILVSMEVDIDEVYFDKDSISAFCTELYFSTIKFFEDFADIAEPFLDLGQKAVLTYKTEQEMIEERADDWIEDRIDEGFVFKSTISAWLPHRHFGFASIKTIEGKQSVYVPQNCVAKNHQYRLRKGALIQFQLVWNRIHPRPKATNVRLL